MLGLTAALAFVAAPAASPRPRPPRPPQPQAYAFKALNGKLRVVADDNVAFPGSLATYQSRTTSIFTAHRSRIPAGIVSFRPGQKSKVHVPATAVVSGTETQKNGDGTTNSCSGSGSRTIRTAIDIDFVATKTTVRASWNIPNYYFNGKCGKPWGFDAAVGHETDPKGKFKRIEPVITVDGQRVLAEGPSNGARQTMEWKGTLTLKRLQGSGFGG